MSIYNEITDLSPKFAFLEVVSSDRIGLVGELCSVISAAGADIGSHHARVYSNDKGQQMSSFKAKISFEGADLDALLHRLDRVRGVRSVTARSREA